MIRRRVFESSAKRVGSGSWEGLARYLCDKFDCDVSMSDFGWMALNIDLGGGNYTYVELFAEWSIRRKRCNVKCYMPDIEDTPFVCTTVSSSNFQCDYDDVYRTIKRRLMDLR